MVHWFISLVPKPYFILKLAGQKIFCPGNFNIKIGPGDEAIGSSTVATLIIVKGLLDFDLLPSNNNFLCSQYMLCLGPMGCEIYRNFYVAECFNIKWNTESEGNLNLTLRHESKGSVIRNTYMGSFIATFIRNASRAIGYPVQQRLIGHGMVWGLNRGKNYFMNNNGLLRRRKHRRPCCGRNRVCPHHPRLRRYHRLLPVLPFSALQSPAHPPPPLRHGPSRGCLESHRPPGLLPLLRCLQQLFPAATGRFLQVPSFRS